MSKKNILIYHPSGMFYGSTEKLLAFLGQHLACEFNVFFAYAPSLGEFLKPEVEKMGMTLVPFTFKEAQKREPFFLRGMNPGIGRIVKDYNINCIFTVINAHYQFPINRIPASIPLILVSPFGHYSTNGNVQKVYVSGFQNLKRLQKRGVKNAEVLFNPLEDFSEEILNKPPVGDVITFGRIGRGDDSIYDPIAVKAFKKMENLYGDKVRYIVVNPPPQWKIDATNLGIKNMEYRSALSQADLPKFYHEIDIFAHARRDGETIGIAIGEAMMAGNPIVSHESHFHNDHLFLLDPAYSRVAKVDDSDGYFENMKWFAQHKDEIRLMGKLARQKALSVFGLSVQLPGVIQDFKQVINFYYNDRLWGQARGYVKLWLENFKSIPFMLGKYVSYKIPSLYNRLRAFHEK